MDDAENRPAEDKDENRPAEDKDELPPPEGVRSDHAGTGAGVVGPAPAGGEPEAIPDSPAGDPEPPSGAGATAGGGYGVASERPSSGNSGEGETPAGEDAQTQWLRSTERQS
jgi:hypothetical protein